MNTYKVGECLVPLTIEKLRKEYIDGGKCKRIEHFSPQSSADRLRILAVDENITVIEEYDNPDEYVPEEFELSPDYFTPNGDLWEGLPWHCEKMHKRWLFGDAEGPYKPGEKKPFYFLIGKAEGVVNEEEYPMQVAAGPLNVLSYDALDSITVWVKE